MTFRDLLELMKEIDGILDKDMPIYFENGKEIGGLAFAERISGADEPTIFIY